MKIIRIIWAFIFISGAIFLTRSEISAQDSIPCQPSDMAVAVYNFVPEAKRQTGDFRPLMKSETTFVQKLHDAKNFDGRRSHDVDLAGRDDAVKLFRFTMI